MISLDQSLDPTTPEGEIFLAAIQGNILKSHGRNYQSQVFVRFGGDPAAARQWVAGFAPITVTSALEQRRQTQRLKSGDQIGGSELFGSIAFSYKGYQALGVPADAIPQEPASLIKQDFSYFQSGMKAFAASPLPYNDPPVSEWETNYQGDIHAMITLAHASKEALDQATGSLTTALAIAGFETFVEEGDQLTHEFTEGSSVPIEHFGFEDGISDPFTLTTDIQERCENDGCERWNPGAPLSLLLIPEPPLVTPSLGPASEPRYGSFILFRKLEQNVLGFSEGLKALAKFLGDPNTDRAGAMAVGRHRNGIPVGSYSPPPMPAPDHGDGHPNDFNYDEDPMGLQCPFQAHLRKSNPRGTSALGPDLERMFRIARRGITYGLRPDISDSTIEPPTGGVGLLFMSHQARNEQFAIQQNGADANDFVQPGTGVDAVNGRNPQPDPQAWPIGSDKRFTMANFVRMLGGEYFYAPSMAFLRDLGGPAPTPDA